MTYYNALASGYDKLYQEEQLIKLQILLQHVRFHGKILDIGAGTCIVAKHLKGTKITITSIDPSKKMLDQGIGERYVAKAEHLPFADKTFDGIISLTALHHCDLRQALSEIKRVAKPKAVIALSFLRTSPKLKTFERLLNTFFDDYYKTEAHQDFLYLIEHTK